MFKPSQPMMARLRLTTKQVNGGYYKGNRTGSMGRFTKSGYYLVDYKKARTYVVPEGLESFKLTPFVTKRAEPKPDLYTKAIKSIGKRKNATDGLKGEDFLNLWSDRNVEEVLQGQKKMRKEEQRHKEKAGASQSTAQDSA